MNQPTFINISRGKPITHSGIDARVEQKIDLLWPYHLSRLAVDTWMNGQAETTTETSDFERLITVRTSLDGQHWTDQEPKWVPASDKSTLGSGPTFVAILKRPVFTRFVAVVLRGFNKKIQVRCLSNSASVIKDESQKYSMGSTTERAANDVGVMVVGGSNTVMRYGWSKAISESPTQVRAAAALGASSNIFAVRTLADHPNPDAEVLLYNANVIEYPLMKFGDYDFELARDATKHVLAYCDEHKLFPINIIWPEQNYIDAAEAGDYQLAADSYFANLSYELSIPYVDGYQVLKVVQESLRRDRRSLFRDTAHLNHFTAQIIGRAISKLVGQLKTEGTLNNRTTAQQLTRAFKAIDVSEWEHTDAHLHYSPKSVSNSLITQSFVQLRAQHPVTLRIPHGWELVGYLLNARNSNASICLEGEGNLSKRASFKAFNSSPNAAPFVCVRALPYPLRPNANGEIKVSVVTPSATDFPDRLLSGAGELNTNQQSIEIGQFILRKTVGDQKRAMVSGLELDLTPKVIAQLETRR